MALSHSRCGPNLLRIFWWYSTPRNGICPCVPNRDAVNRNATNGPRKQTKSAGNLTDDKSSVLLTVAVFWEGLDTKRWNSQHSKNLSLSALLQRSRNYVLRLCCQSCWCVEGPVMTRRTVDLKRRIKTIQTMELSASNRKSKLPKWISELA